MKRVLAMLLMVALSACGGGGGGNSGTIPGVNSTPTPPPNTSDDCPTSGAVPSFVSTGSTAQSVRIRPTGSQAKNVPGMYAVTFAQQRESEIAARVNGLNARTIRTLRYSSLGVATRVISIDTASASSTLAELRAAPGVRDVVPIRYVQHQSISANDPYYTGFTGTLAPYYEAAAVPGQWDMHAINVDGAWSQFTSAPIIGAPIAIVDTGADVTHPELITPSGVTAPKIIRTQCYVTYPSSSSQTSSQYVTDTDGHGTNVTGIADGDTNNSFAFASVGFDAPLLIYRIFPTDPSGGCEGSTSPQCESNSADEATAINDAVAHGAKVINLSLGSDSAGSCNSNDPEYQAVENAINSGVVVVAAAGNGNSSGVGQAYLDCPAADPGVIAVGASALNDSGVSTYEYVASYSNYLTTKGTSNGGAYLVAPGGDPCSGSSSSSCNDTDDLHWIEHIYSSTAAVPGSCSKDFAGETGDCRILIAGTSQATPHVTGVVSLMLAKNPNLTPAQIATGLCASADTINDSKQGCGRVNASAAVSWAATH